MPTNDRIAIGLLAPINAVVSLGHYATGGTHAATFLKAASNLCLHAHRYASNAPGADSVEWARLHTLATDLCAVAQKADGYLGVFPPEGTHLTLAP